MRVIGIREFPAHLDRRAAEAARRVVPGHDQRIAHEEPGDVVRGFVRVPAKFAPLRAADALPEKREIKGEDENDAAHDPGPRFFRGGLAGFVSQFGIHFSGAGSKRASTALCCDLPPGSGRHSTARQPRPAKK